MGASFHFSGKSLSIDAHSNSRHFSYSERGLVELISPSIHLCLPLWEPFWNDLREVISSTFWSLTNFPHEPPFSVHDWFHW